MAAALTHHSYGKSRIRLTKLTRHADRHDLAELAIDIRLEGAFSEAYLHGDNSRIVATDSMKNAVYVLARTHDWSAPEEFGIVLSEFFLRTYAHVSGTTVQLAESPWHRIAAERAAHPHAFFGGGSETRTALVTGSRAGTTITSGLEGLSLLKTTDSAFRGFLRDAYTTLPETDDRILATVLSARWQCTASVSDWNGTFDSIRHVLLDTFALHRSHSVQETLYAMANAVVDHVPAVEELTLTMPNLHRVLANLQPFGLDNPNMIFVPTAEPSGWITGTVKREASS